MKVIRVQDDAHRGIRIAAAKSGRTDIQTATLLIRYALGRLESGKINLDRLEKGEARAGK